MQPRRLFGLQSSTNAKFHEDKNSFVRNLKKTPNLLCLTKSGWLKQFPSHPRHNPPAFFFKKLRSDGYGCSDMFGTFVNARLLTDRRVSKNDLKKTTCPAWHKLWHELPGAI